jgi:membrane fusion protein (multidrug efflux system)
VITSGLSAGEKVVVEGLQKIKAGAPVTVKPWTPPAEKPAEGTSAETAAKPETKTATK